MRAIYVRCALWIVLGGCGDGSRRQPESSADDDGSAATTQDAADPDEEPSDELDGAGESGEAAEAADGTDASDEPNPDISDGGAPSEDSAVNLADGGDMTACAADDFQLDFNTPDPTRDRFDPNEIAIVGTVSQGTCGYEVVAPWNEPNRALMGFGCGVSAEVIRPTDGRLVYLDGDTRQVRVFACDGCTYVHPQDRFRRDAVHNDPIIATPGCDAANPPAYFLLSPEGQMIHRCGTSTTWYDAAGQVVFSGAYALSYGVEGWLLSADNRLVSSLSGASVPIQGLPAEVNRLAYRATQSGFWIAVAPAGSYEPIDLWHVTFDGQASRLGTYPDAPPAANASFSLADSNGLDAAGRFYQIVRSRDHSFYDVIVRRELNRPSEIIYDEITNPILRVHISKLVTGPGPLDESKRDAWGGDITAPYCPSPAELWTYTARSSPPQSSPVAVPIPDPRPGPGVACGQTRCAGGDVVCCGPSWPEFTGGLGCKLHRERRSSDTSLDEACSFPDVFAACDQSSDCATASDDPNDPAVCCFISGVGGGSRECTTARTCAGSAKRASSIYAFQYTGILACQEDADCALAAQPSRCVSDGGLTGMLATNPIITGTPAANPQAGRCEGTVSPPDGTTLMASWIRCGDAMCSHEASRGCCHTGALEGGTLGLGVSTMEEPRCQAACSTDSTTGRYAAFSQCDDPSDCNDPAAADPADPFECCFAENVWGGPWGRACQRRSACRFFACESESDCDRIHPALTCRPERTLTGGGKARPEVRSCQDP